MHLGAQFVWLNCDNAEALDPLFSFAPSLPKATKSELPALLHPNVNRLLSALVLPPLVKAIRQDKASPLFVGVPERGLARDGFRPRIDKSVADSFILSPERD